MFLLMCMPMMSMFMRNSATRFHNNNYLYYSTLMDPLHTPPLSYPFQEPYSQAHEPLPWPGPLFVAGLGREALAQGFRGFRV